MVNIFFYVGTPSGVHLFDHLPNTNKTITLKEKDIIITDEKEVANTFNNCKSYSLVGPQA